VLETSRALASLIILRNRDRPITEKSEPAVTLPITDRLLPNTPRADELIEPPTLASDAVEQTLPVLVVPQILTLDPKNDFPMIEENDETSVPPLTVSVSLRRTDPEQTILSWTNKSFDTDTDEPNAAFSRTVSVDKRLTPKIDAVDPMQVFPVTDIFAPTQ